MGNLELELKEYFNDIKKKLICSNDVKKSFMIEFKNSITDYIDENSDVTM